jgi:hypothetical protein
MRSNVVQRVSTRRKPTTYHPRGEHANYYTADAVDILSVLPIQCYVKLYSMVAVISVFVIDPPSMSPVCLHGVLFVILVMNLPEILLARLNTICTWMLLYKVC